MSGRVVLKYPMQIGRGQVTAHRLPAGAKPLTVQSQRGDVQLWAEVDPLAEAEPRSFICVPTGDPDVPIDDRYVHIGSVQTHEEQLMWHFYEVVSMEVADLRKMDS